MYKRCPFCIATFHTLLRSLRCVRKWQNKHHEIILSRMGRNVISSPVTTGAKPKNSEDINVYQCIQIVKQYTYTSYNYCNHCICLHNEYMLSLHISPLLIQGACAFPPQITRVPAATFWSRNLSTAWIPPVRSTVKPLQVGELNPEPAASCAVFWNARVDKWHNQVCCMGF